MAMIEEKSLAPFYDGLEAVVRALVSELATENPNLRKRLALAAAANIRENAKGVKSDAAQGIMLIVAARVCGVPTESILQ